MRSFPLTKPRISPMNQYRQGHILLNPAPIPKHATRKEHDRHAVIATGESGREHVFKSERVHIFMDGANLYIEIRGDDPVTLEDPEHGDIDIEPGTYRVVEQREADTYRAERVSFD